jgi:hypothetical protein
MEEGRDIRLFAFLEQEHRYRTMTSDGLCHAAQCPVFEACFSMAAHDDAIDLLQVGRREDRLSRETISYLQSGPYVRKVIGTGYVFQITDRLGMCSLRGLFGLLRWVQEGCHGIERVRDDAQEKDRPTRVSRQSRCNRDGTFCAWRPIQRNKNTLKHYLSPFNG